MQDVSDEALVKRVVDDDQELYVHIVERFEAPLLRYAQSIVFDADAASDVVQQSFIKAFVNLRGFNAKFKFSSWLYRIVHNEAVNYLRKHKREVKPDDTWWSKLADKADSLDEVLDRRLVKKQLGSALNKLDLKYRQPLVLHYLENKSYKQISDILRIPSSTVGVRISRAKSQLEHLMEKGARDE